MAGALVAFGLHRRDAPGDRSKAAVAAVFGFAGFAPDMDGAIDFLSERVDALWWLQHRGVSHTLVGAPVFALALLGALVALSRAWPRRFSLFAWRPALVPVAVLGSLTHLLFDAVTFAGVPLFWPFADGRVSLQFYHWIVGYAFFPAVIVLALHAFGRLSRRGVVAGAAVVLAILLVVGGVRAWSRPVDVGDGALVFPRGSELEWSVLRALPNGSWEARLHRLGVEGPPVFFEPSVPPEAEAAVAAARDTAAFRGFVMGSFGPNVVRAEPLGDGGWNVTFVDVAQRFEALNGPRWTPVEPFDEWGYVRFHVRGADVVVVHRGW